MPSTMDKVLYFIRHARPENDARSFHVSAFADDMLGKKDESLSQVGREQAKAAGHALRAAGIERVVSSSLRRAIQTAEIISSAIDRPYSERFGGLSELKPGRLGVEPSLSRVVRASRKLPAGLRLPLTRAAGGALAVAYLVAWRGGLTSGGDSLLAARQRVANMLAELAARRERTIAIVGHGYWIWTMAEAITGTSGFRPGRAWVPNCSVTRVECSTRGTFDLSYFARPFERFRP